MCMRACVCVGINQELETEEGGPDRNTAYHRIKKAQVSNYSISCSMLYDSVIGVENKLCFLL